MDTEFHQISLVVLFLLPSSLGKLIALDERLFGEDIFEHPNIVSSQDEADLLFLVSTADQPLNEFGQILDLLKTIDELGLVQRMVLVLEGPRSIVFDKIETQGYVLHP